MASGITNQVSAGNYDGILNTLKIDPDKGIEVASAILKQAESQPISLRFLEKTVSYMTSHSLLEQKMTRQLIDSIYREECWRIRYEVGNETQESATIIANLLNQTHVGETKYNLLLYYFLSELSVKNSPELLHEIRNKIGITIGNVIHLHPFSLRFLEKTISYMTSHSLVEQKTTRQLIDSTYREECWVIRYAVRNENQESATIIAKVLNHTHVGDTKYNLLLYYFLSELSENNSPELLQEVRNKIGITFGNVIHLHPSCLGLLIEKSPQPILDQNPHLFAIAAGQADLSVFMAVKELHEKENCPVTLPMYRAALKKAMEYVAGQDCKGIDVLEHLVKNAPPEALRLGYGQTVLHVAKGKALECVLRELTFKGTLSNYINQDHDGNTPLYHCSSCEDAHMLIEACKPFAAKLVSRNRNAGWTPLHGASLSVAIEMAEQLKEFLSELLAPDFRGWTPLHQLVQHDQKPEELKRFLETIEPLFESAIFQRTQEGFGKNAMQIATSANLAVLRQFCVDQIEKEKCVPNQKTEVIFNALLSSMGDNEEDMEFFDKLFMESKFLLLARRSRLGIEITQKVLGFQTKKRKFLQSKF